MRRKLIFIILGALVVLGLIVFVWFWFFGRNTQTPGGGGGFDTAEDRPGGGGTGGTGGNQQTPFGTGDNQDTSSSGGSATFQPTVSIYDNAGAPTGGGAPGTVGSAGEVAPPAAVYPGAIPGVTWIDGSVGSGSAGGGTGNLQSFNPTPVNQLNTVNINGTGYFNSSSSGGSDGLDPALAGLIGCTAGFLTGLAETAITTAVTGLFAVTVNAPVSNLKDADTLMKDFLGCIARTIARQALQKITSSVVDWINSGFDGSPAIVQDYKQFFLSAADQALGEFIQGSDLSFLCSPFQSQVKVAIAQSYARPSAGVGGGSGSGGTVGPSCTLSGVVGNVDAFLQNGFSSGGWPGLLAYTTEPTNNPYGAYMYGVQAANQIQAQAVQTARDELTFSGYKPYKELYDCKPTGGSTPDCKTRIVTPTAAVEGIAQNTLDLPTAALNAAKNFDEIISALLTQLVNRAIYQGLSNLSGQNGYESNFSSAENTQARLAAEDLLAQMQGAINLAGQYGSNAQGSIRDIQNAQGQLVELQNCWSGVASSTGITATQQSQALTNAAGAASRVQELEAQVQFYNSQITTANAAIARVQELQTNALAARSLSDVQNVEASFTTAQNSGTLITQSAVTSAQQDRTTLQAQMAARNQQTATELAQCHAF